MRKTVHAYQLMSNMPGQTPTGAAAGFVAASYHVGHHAGTHAANDVFTEMLVLYEVFQEPNIS